MIELRDQAYYFLGLPKDLHIISPQVIRTPEGYKGTLISNCHNENDSYGELNLKEEKPGSHNTKPVERVYVKYDPKNNLPTHEDTIPTQIYKEVKALASDVCVTNQDNQNLTTSQKQLPQWYFILGNIGFQHVQWFICTWRLKVQGNSKAVANYESPKYSEYDFGKGRHRSNKLNTTKNNPTKEQELTKDHLLTG